MNNPRGFNTPKDKTNTNTKTPDSGKTDGERSDYDRYWRRILTTWLITNNYRGGKRQNPSSNS